MSQHTPIKLSRDAYTVGWISPLEVEMSAARYLLMQSMLLWKVSLEILIAIPWEKSMATT